MTKTEIAEQLQIKRAAITALLAKNNLSLSSVLSSEQMSIVEQVDAVLGLEEAPQDIGKKAFVEYVQDWVSDFIFILDEKRDSDIEMEVESITRSLREQIKKIDFPISTILWKKLKAEIDALPSFTTSEELRKALLRGFNAFNSEMGEKFELTKHYKENKAIYKKVKEKELNSLIMIADEFEAWLNGLLAFVNKNKKTEEELRSEYNILVDDFLHGFARDINAIKINTPRAEYDTVSMDMKALFRNLGTALDDSRARHSPVSSNLWEFVNKNLSSESYYEMEDVRSQLNRWCRSAADDGWYEAHFKYWKEHKKGFPNTSLIASAVNDACIDISADTIQQHLIEWTKSVKDAFVMSKNYNIIIEKAQRNFKELFDESSNKGVSTLFFYTDILDTLLKANGEVARLEQLKNTAWEKSLLQIVEKQRVANYFGEWREKYGPYVVKEFNEELDTLLPTTEEIQQAILKSVERKKEIRIPEVETDLLVDLVISSSKIDNYKKRKKLFVNLAYKNYPTSKDGVLTDVLAVVPTKVVVEEGNNEESKSELRVIDTKIKKTIAYKGGSASTTVKLTFMAVTDVEKLFDSIDMESISYKGKNLGGLLKKINAGVSIKGAGIMMGVEDFIYKSKNVEYFTVEFTVGSNLLEGKDKVIDLQTSISCSNSDFSVKFGDGKTFIGGRTFLTPAYDYK